jgi:hypothetical protein
MSKSYVKEPSMNGKEPVETKYYRELWMGGPVRTEAECGQKTWGH